MKPLIAEDDFANRALMRAILRSYGTTQVAVNGVEAVEAVRASLQAGEELFDLICLDIMMPEMDGHEALRQIRALEEQQGIHSQSGAKIIMITALDDIKNAMSAFHNLCDAYLTKPIDKAQVIEKLQELGLIL